MTDIYSEIVKALKEKEELTLATLVSRIGSAPRGVGAKYLVREDGTTVGSIGGGCIEAEVWQKAQEVREQGKGSVLHFNLTAEQLAEGGLICGGDIKIFLEPLNEEFFDIYQEVVRIKQRGGAAILATLISVDGATPSGKGVKALMNRSGEKAGFLPGGEELERRILDEGKALLIDKKTKILSLNSERDAIPAHQMEILLEPIFCEPTVYLFGAGHVSEQLAPFAKKVQFRVVVIDDREMFANRERFPEADQIVVSEFEKCFEKLNIDDSSYIVIVTRGHLHDGFVLEQAVKTDARYIGMIGSKKKIHILYQDLIKKGIPRETLNRVHAPIGLDIYSETPEEIAVSIVAELIKVRGQPNI